MNGCLSFGYCCSPKSNYWNLRRAMTAWDNAIMQPSLTQFEFSCYCEGLENEGVVKARNETFTRVVA